MLYITGEEETLGDLARAEDFSGSLEEYCRLFYQNNDHLRHGLSPNEPLAQFTPIFLSSPCKEQKLVAKEIQLFSKPDRKRLKQIQDSGHDPVMLVVMQDIMEELQPYAENFRKHYDLPLISTPWSILNNSLTNASFIDILSETAIYTSFSLKNSRKRLFFDGLYENLMQRDDLNRRLLMLKKSKEPGVAILQKTLEKQIKNLTCEIKTGLNAKINNKLPKYLSPFGFDEIRKMKMGSFSMKMARKNQLTTVRFDLLNRSGVALLNKLSPSLQIIGENAGKISTMLGIGAVVYDVTSAYRKGDSTARAFLTGATGITTSMAIAASGASLSSLGGSALSTTLILGGIAGETAAGATTVLLCTPAGVIILTVAGAAVAGYATYKASEYVGELWDKYGDEVSKKISEHAQMAGKKISEGWRSSSQWVIDFYQLPK